VIEVPPIHPLCLPAALGWEVSLRSCTPDSLNESPHIPEVGELAARRTPMVWQSTISIPITPSPCLTLSIPRTVVHSEVLGGWCKGSSYIHWRLIATHALGINVIS
jgi:hypothetical protein